MKGTSVIQPAGRITFRVAMGMINPGAVLLSAVVPAILGIMLAKEQAEILPVLLTVLVVLIPALMNASVDVLNDYYDYVQGNDTAENIVSEDDAPLAYHRVQDPKLAFWLGIGLAAAAGVLGIYVIWRAGWVPGVVGLAGAVVMLTYSGSRASTSYLPIGEILSGVTLGGLVPIGVYSALTGTADWLVFYKTLPLVFLVSQFMLVNNTCDIERDQTVGRKTLPVMIGREKAQWMACLVTTVWLLQMLHVVAVWYTRGLPALLLALALSGKGFLSIYKTARTPENKTPAVIAVTVASFGVAGGYLLAVAMDLLLR